MQRFRQAMATVSAAWARLTTSQRLLIGSVIVVLAMAMLLVQLYTGAPSMVPLLPGATPEQESQALRFLQASAIEHSQENGQIVVPAAQRRLLLAQMAQNNALPDDSRLVFDNLIKKQSWTLSQRQNSQLETIAVQNELGAIISKMSGVRAAQVILNLPEKRGFGQTAGEPSASATVFPSRPLDQNTVDSIAHLVAGARGIDPKNVRVIDGTTNRQLRARDENNLLASSYLEYVAAIEARKQSQIHDMLASYIKGVIVTVHAQVDSTRRRTQRTAVLPESKGTTSVLISEQSSSRQDSEPRPGGEPGPRSNTGQDIAGFSSGGAGASTRETRGDSQFQVQFGQESTVVDDPRGYPTKINAVVNIPRAYFVEVLRSQGPAPAEGQAPKEPTEDELKPVIESETTRIKKEVELQIDTSASADTIKGEVQVSMIPSGPAGGGGASGSGSEGGSSAGAFGSGGVLATDRLGTTIGLSILAVLALGLVVVTAMRAARKPELPSPTELVGVPPALQTQDDLVGEAGEADSALLGIELTDEEVKQRKVHEQVSELVQERPDEAARLLGRWMTGT